MYKSLAVWAALNPLQGRETTETKGSHRVVWYRPGYPAPGFSLVELMVAIAILAGLVALGLGAGAEVLKTVNKADSLSRLRTLGQAVNLFASENDYFLPGPLWPGQMLVYDPDRSGRLVRDLAPYLEIETRPSAYFVEKMQPRAYRGVMTSGPRDQMRVYVLNTEIFRNGVTLHPFGSLTASPPISQTLRLNQLTDIEEEERWMLSEADQFHPDVSSAPWKKNTPATPVHGQQRARLGFDGSAHFSPVLF